MIQNSDFDNDQRAKIPELPSRFSDEQPAAAGQGRQRMIPSNGSVPLADKVALSVKDVASLTSRAMSSVWEEIRQQKYPVVRIGGRVLVLKADLMAYLESSRDWTGEPKFTTRGRKKHQEVI